MLGVPKHEFHKKSLFIIQHHNRRAYGRVIIYFHVFLTSKLDGGTWWMSRPVHFSSWDRLPNTHWIDSKVIIKDSPDVFQKIGLCWELTPDLLVIEPTTQLLYSLSYPNSIFWCELMPDGQNFSSFDRASQALRVQWLWLQPHHDETRVYQCST